MALFGKQAAILTILLAGILVLTGSIVGATPKSPTLGGLAPILILGAMTWYLLMLAFNRNEIIAGLATLFKMPRQTSTKTNIWLTAAAYGVLIALGIFLLWMGLPQRILGQIEGIAANFGQGGSTSSPAQIGPLSGLFFSAPIVYYGVAMVAAIFAMSFFFLLRGIHLALRTKRASPIDEEVDVQREISEVVQQTVISLRATKDYHDTIVQCYKSMCKILSSAGIEAGRDETAREFAKSMYAKLQIGGDSVRGLTFLFEEARYSNPEISEEKRIMALSHLESLERALSPSVVTGK